MVHKLTDKNWSANDAERRLLALGRRHAKLNGLEWGLKTKKGEPKDKRTWEEKTRRERRAHARLKGNLKGWRLPG